MTPAPHHEPTAPTHLLTIAEYAALGETEPGYTELVEGRLLMSPSPTPKHNIASGRLYTQLGGQMPAGFEAIQDIDIDLELGPPDGPGSSRPPDLVVVERHEVDRVDTGGGMCMPRRSWSSSRSFRRARGGSTITTSATNMDHQRVSGRFAAVEPFEVAVDLEKLGA